MQKREMITSPGFFWISNSCLAIFSGYFAYDSYFAFYRTGAIQVLLLFIVECIVAILFVIRHPTRRVSSRPYDWAITTAVSLVGFLFRASEISRYVVFGKYIQIFGFIFQIISLLTLNRRFGLVPAHRGIQVKGIYQIVRHPLYVGYLLNYAGYTLTFPSSRNVLILCLSFVLYVLRILNEERFLSTDKAYRDYQDKVKWKLIPCIF